MTEGLESDNHIAWLEKELAEATARAERLAEALNDLRCALRSARSHLVTLGGDPSGLSEEEAQKHGVDMIQWTMLHEIDSAIRAARSAKAPEAGPSAIRDAALEEAAKVVEASSEMVSHVNHSGLSVWSPPDSKYFAATIRALRSSPPGAKPAAPVLTEEPHEDQ